LCIIKLTFYIKSNKKEMSRATFGTNTDNFNITGNTFITNLTVSGTASFPNNSIASTCISGSIGSATTANAIKLTAAYGGTFYPCLTAGVSASESIYQDAGLSYNSTTDTLTVTNVSTETINVPSITCAFLTVIEGGTASFPINSISSTCISGSITAAACTGNSATATWSSVASTVQNTQLGIIDSTWFYLPFLASSSTNTTGQILYTEAGNWTTGALAYNPTSKHLACDWISADITGNLTGTATNTTRINSYAADTINNTIYYPLLVPLSTTSISQKSYSDSGLSYNSTTNTLTVGNIVGNIVATTSIASTIKISAAPAGTFYPCLTSGASTSGSIYQDGGLSYDATSNALTAGSFITPNDILVNTLRLGKGKNNNDFSTAFGFGALNSTIGIGGNSTVTGNATHNTAMGYNALGATTTGQYNTSFGDYTNYQMTTGQYNIAMGHFSMLSNLTGSFNTTIGGLTYITTGNCNTSIGYSAGGNSLFTTGNNNLFLGYGSGSELTTNVSNTACLGTSTITDSYIYGNLHFGLTTLSPIIFSYLIGITSNVQTQINNFTATTPSEITITAVPAGNIIFYPCLTFGVSPNVSNPIYIDQTGLSYDATTNALTAGSFIGTCTTATTALACTGNSATATTALACTGNSATATTALACTGNSATADTAAACFVCTGNSATATTALACTGNSATANTATTASACTGNSATANTATTASACTGNSATATNANTAAAIKISAAPAGVFYPSLTSGVSLSESIYQDAGLSYDATSNALTAGSFIGNSTNATTAAYANQVSIIGANSTATVQYIPFLNNSNLGTTNNQLRTGPMNYVSNTDTLTVTNIVGNSATATTATACTGNSATATTATNITPLSDNSGTLAYLTFANSTTSQQLKIDDVTGPLSYTPSTGVLNCGGLTTSGGGITLPTTATGYTASAYAAGTYGTSAGKIGSIVSGTMASSIVPAGTTVSTIVLSVGVWTIFGSMYCSASDGSFPYVSISKTTALNNNVLTLGYNNGAITTCSVSTCVSLVSSTNYYLIAQKCTGVSVVGQFQAIRIA
jgi:hypothetical protein